MRSVLLAFVQVLIAVSSFAQIAGISIDIRKYTPDEPDKPPKIRYTISGRVMDAENGQPIENAYLLFDTIQFIGTHTDSSGLFTFTNVPIGWHNIKVSHIAFLPTVVSVDVSPTRSMMLVFPMKPRVITLDPIRVVYDTKNEALPASTVPLDRSQLTRGIGIRYNDFAIQVQAMPGLQSADDSRNDVVVRGNSPQSVLWRLEGVSLPNPNHFAFPGTSGGPVAIINSRMLGNSSFLSGAFPAQFGNTTSGIFDLYYRPGDTTAYIHSVDFGLLGVSAMSEGRLSERTQSSYVVSSRISTANMFSALGVDIGIESIPRYWDGTFNVNFPLGAKKGKLPGADGIIKVFGMGGKSDIDIVLSKSKDPFNNIYGEKDRDQYFGSDMGILGITYNRPLKSEKGQVVMTLAGSGQLIHSYHEFVYPIDVRNALKAQNGTQSRPDIMPPVQWYEFRESRLSAAYNYSTHLKEDTIRMRWKTYFHAGVTADVYFVDYRDSARAVNVPIGDQDFGTWRRRWWSNDVFLLLQPYAQYNLVLSNLEITLGAHSQYLSLNNSVSWIEPRIAMRYQLRTDTARSDNERWLTAAIGFHSQMQQPNLYYYGASNNANGIPISLSRNMDFTRSFHAVVGFENKIWPGKSESPLRLKAEAYFQYLYSVPVTDTLSSYSLLNTGADFRRVYLETPLVNTGVGYNYGIEVTLEKTFSNGYLFYLTGSLFESTYKGSDGVLRGTDFDGNYILNGVFRREWSILGDKHLLTMGTKFTTVGGRRYGPVDSLQSVIIKDVSYIDAERNTEQFKPYVRLDLRIGYRINSRKATHEIGVDAMNVLNIQNVLRLTYKPGLQTSGRVETEYQLGFIPFFYYRWEFNSTGTKARRG